MFKLLMTNVTAQML